MKKQRGSIRIGAILTVIMLIIVLTISFNKYKENYFNGFEKAVSKQNANTIFIRDDEIKYSNNDSYKIENNEFNDAVIYKEIEVEPNTMYKISCMVKTENVKCKTPKNDGGVSIGILETTEYSKTIEGTNDWQYVEFMFNSKNRDKVKISFRLGGNQNDCTGTAWFSDFKLEKGTPNKDYDWKMGCFVIKELNVNIDGKQYKFNINLEDLENIRLNLERFKDDCFEFSGEKMNVSYDILEVNIPVNTISYSDEHGYFISYLDVKNIIYDTVKEKEYDHVFVISRMEDEEGTLTIPIYDNWIGLGSMDMYGIGYSTIRINKNSNRYTYKYDIVNQAPEEVYLHEFCHTLERNLMEYGYKIPALHDHEKYGYTDLSVDGLNDWYRDYMSKKILDRTTGEYIGLDSFCYLTQPPNSQNFRYTVEVDFNKEPQNLIEEILTVLDVFKK